MRIGFDAKRLFHNNTGLGNYSRDLLRVLSEYYPENSYFLYNPKQTQQYSSLLDNPALIQRLPKWFLGKWFRGLWRTFGQVTQIKKDHISVYHGLSGEIPRGLPQNVKSVVTIHDLIFMRYPELYSFFDRKIHYLKFKHAAQRADIVVAISQQTKDDIVKYLRISPEKIKVIYQGCAPVFKDFFSEQELEDIRQKWNLPEQFVLNVGTIEPRKNALNIVKAIKDIDTTLVLIGRKTAYYSRIQEYIDIHQLQHKIIYLSGISQRELAGVYRLATVFVYPSIFEGFGIPIIEALFSGTPVITNGSGVFPEAGGEGSLYVKVDDVDDLQSKIRCLLSDESFRQNLIRQGKQHLTPFTDTYIAKVWKETYESLLVKS